MLLKKIKVALGIIFGRALTGPVEVSVDLTRKCSMDCMMCWWWSPLLKVRPHTDWANKEISFELFKQLIKDFKKSQVKRIILGGQGEPFCYPKLFLVIELAKRSGIQVALITGGFFLNPDNIKKIVDLKVDSLDVSLQAATTETYKKIHPNLPEEAFNRIKEQLILLSKLKKEKNSLFPRLRIIDVVCSLNYHETVKIVDLAREVGADSIGYKRIDVIPETKELLLDQQQLNELKGLIKVAEAEAKKQGVSTSLGFYNKYIVEGLVSGTYTNDYYSRIPCYVGWLSARILSDGSVIPCCGCYNVIFGNINDKSFFEIWNSKEYKDFRIEAKNICKNPELSKKCNCRSCIDFEFNLGVYHKLHPFGSGDRIS